MANSAYGQVSAELQRAPARWLVTGAAGFIGSNLVEALLKLDQHVVGLDNFATGHRSNLAEVETIVGPHRWQRFRFIESDIRDHDACRHALREIDHVLHQAALGSVPRSVADPLTTNGANIDGFLNMLVAARDAGVRSFTYAASSSTYGDHEALPKIEDRIGRPLSPYAVTKLVNELYAEVFARTYGFKATGLRYFNVFGQRQDPAGAYAAVIPRWIAAMTQDAEITINGDGETSRDFCFVANAVQANLLAACADEASRGRIYNVAVGGRTSLNDLFGLLRDILGERGIAYARPPVHAGFRPGDVRHSQADIGLARNLLGYVPTHDIRQGLEAAADWYLPSAVSGKQRVAQGKTDPEAGLDLSGSAR